ncbi:MAG: L,D-transpeptidase [Silicimonas sp.]|nr:L,D-transpeptidase [Silicimonas sp.]
MLLDRRDILTGSIACAAAFAAPPALAARKKDEEVDPFKARVVRVPKDTVPGRLHVYPDRFAIYWTLEKGRAIYYPAGVAQRHLWEPGTFIVKAKKEWPSWKPTPEMIERDPEAYEKWAEEAMPGGPNNPLGARALYLFYPRGGDSFLRIHGTNNPRTIRTRVSNGCARLTNHYISDLYERVPMDTIVHLHPMQT